jgi:hypothetical protein
MDVALALKSLDAAAPREHGALKGAGNRQSKYIHAEYID